MFSKAGRYLVMAILTVGITLAVLWEMVRDPLTYVVNHILPPLLALYLLAFAMDFTDRLT